MQHLQFSYYFSENSDKFNYTNIINFISSHLYLIESNQLIHLPKSLLYSLISNPNLKVKSEDPLFNFIHDIFAKTDTEKPHTPENEDYDYNLITFYELIEPKNLSSAKFCEFLRSLNLNELTNSVWQKLCNTFLVKNYDQKQSNDNNNNRYVENHPSFEFDGDPQHRFEGIIRELTRRGGGNVQDIGTVKVTASTTQSTPLI